MKGFGALVLLVFVWLGPSLSTSSPPADANPTCSNTNVTNDDKEEFECSLYLYNFWLFAGKEIPRNSLVSMKNEVVVKFKQQSRRGFPRWNRYYHLHEHTGFEFTFAPGTEWPFECHDRLYNLRLNNTHNQYELYSDRFIQPLEPIFQECHPDRTLGELDVTTFPNPGDLTLEFLEAEGLCVDRIQIIQNDHDKDASSPSTNVVAQTEIKKGTVVAMGKALHLHRTELYNETSKQQEELLNYCFGHPNSDLLLLPLFSNVNSINHGTNPNVKIEWHSDDLKDYFIKPTEFIFLREHAVLWLQVVALQDIAPGQQLIMDFGEAYAAARAADPLNFRHEKALPSGFFPESWLASETRTLASEMPSIEYTDLAPGQVEQAHLVNGDTLGDYQHRVGLPASLADTLEEWARDLGVLDFIERYVGDKTLKKGGEERMRFNNGTWWTRRFDNEWQSNMHYVSPDDDESNQQYFDALSRGGFDKVLEGIGNFFNFTTLTCYYTSFIVVNHCVEAFMHSDSDHHNVFNLIFPIQQVENAEPELVLGDNNPPDGPANNLHVPYHYERRAGILVGKDGMHGTAPTDYRAQNKTRIVASVYMGDFSQNEEITDQIVAEWADPPYPNYYVGQLKFALTERVHWKRDDDSVHVGGYMPRGIFPLKRPYPHPDLLRQQEEEEEEQERELLEHHQQLQELQKMLQEQQQQQGQQQVYDSIIKAP